MLCCTIREQIDVGNDPKLLMEILEYTKHGNNSDILIMVLVVTDNSI